MEILENVNDLVEKWDSIQSSLAQDSNNLRLSQEELANNV